MAKISKKSLNLLNTLNKLKKTNMEIYKKDRKYMEHALALAIESKMKMQHGSIVTKNGKIIGSGCNSNRTQFKGSHHVDCSCHAEMAALKDALGQQHYSTLPWREKSRKLLSKVV
jgi:tRNA(Arg) A34 adenosine deaminase TadA